MTRDEIVDRIIRKTKRSRKSFVDNLTVGYNEAWMNGLQAAADELGTDLAAAERGELDAKTWMRHMGVLSF